MGTQKVGGKTEDVLSWPRSILSVTQGKREKRRGEPPPIPPYHFFAKISGNIRNLLSKLVSSWPRPRQLEYSSVHILCRWEKLNSNFRVYLDRDPLFETNQVPT